MVKDMQDMLLDWFFAVVVLGCIGTGAYFVLAPLWGG